MDSHQLAHASFSIAGDQVIPEFWTSYFGVKPDTAIVKGEPFITPSRRTSRMPERTSVWGVRSKSAVRNDLLAPHLRYLVEYLELPRADLRDLLNKQAARIRFFCYWANYTGDRIPDVPDDIRAMMESLGGIIEIDEYR
ncbi:DUF4279 domain-containing protein [Paraburkholderia fungorum]|uniref:DUF4279 domain-containing protein n=1 Tax=Paraburkholderia fungorum TaxID=134537 RepID=UPI0038BADCF5